MKVLLISLCIFILCACARDGLETKSTKNPNFSVTFLFEHDGIKVYRFYDEGKYHWFTSKGETINPYSYHLGKIRHTENENIN